MAGQFERQPFLLSAEDVARALDTHLERGLSSAQVAQLQEKYPPNELDIGGTIPWYKIFLKQLFNAMILILFFAMALSFAIQDYVEGGVLLAVIVLNVSIGFYQEYGAEKKMDALRALSAPSAMVLRDGRTDVIPNAQVIPGDVVILKMGDTIPADVRLFEVMNLAADEQSLTGESVPVEKIVEHLDDEELGVGDRINIAYGTTTVRKGRGRGVVVATGMQTEVGKIAASTAKKRKAGRSMNYKKYGKRQPIIGLAKRIYDFVGKFLGLTEGTPLQIKLSKLAYILFGCALILAVIVFAVNKFNVPHEVVIYAISTGIAIIPESLVAVLTITMVVAVTVMRKANVVVRDLSALEALGGVTNICSDKTGTLTQGAMIVRKVWIPSKTIYTVKDSKHPSNPTEGIVTFSEADDPTQEPEKRDFDQERSAAVLKFDVPDEKLHPSKTKKKDEKEATMNPDLEAFLLSAALCNLATVRHEPEPGEGHPEWQVTGEPTEIALQVFAHRFDKGKKAVVAEGWQQVAEFPFDSGIKRMSVIYNGPNSNHSMVFTKGAVERILDLCSSVGVGGEPMTDEYKERILKQMDTFASQGQRVLAIASRSWEGKYEKKTAPEHTENDEVLRASIETDLTLLGLAGIYDPPRKETTPAIAECSSAGIKVHMLTGDHPATAEAIAKEVGIIPRNLGVLSYDVANAIVQKANDFDKLSDAEIDGLPELPLVLARCAPDTKTRMIEALRRRSAYMAMTGDGVNDAPSLSRADVGIAMGSGSDVAKSAAKIVLTDDKFNSIVAAIREGRRMFDNIQKFILHLLTSNIGEVILLICGLGFQDRSGFSVFPISPLEILWINMVTSSFPAFGLGREQASRLVMRKPPNDRRRGVFTNQILADMVVYGLLMGTLSLMTFVIVIYGANGGGLGVNCNTLFSDACEPVFRARATVFVELTWLILVSAWEIKDLRRSLFRLKPDGGGGDRSRFPLFRDLYENRFLFWAVVLGALSVFPVVYIPTLNTSVFKHVGIGWEWSLVVAALVVFVAGMELWKLAKRRFGLLEDAAVVRGPFAQGGDEQHGRKLLHTISFGSLKSWRSIGRSHTADTKEKKEASPSPV
ncbi:potassium/sodium eff [Hypoxylon sp. FL1284]|nr:potassium/sodium eff [Hypoxylon sp. FL1284]